MSKLMYARLYLREVEKILRKELKNQTVLYVENVVHTAPIGEGVEVFYESVVVKHKKGYKQSTGDRFILETFMPIEIGSVLLVVSSHEGNFHSEWIPCNKDTLSIVREKMRGFLSIYRAQLYMPSIMRKLLRDAHGH